MTSTTNTTALAEALQRIADLEVELARVMEDVETRIFALEELTEGMRRNREMSRMVARTFQEGYRGDC